ncbi:FtsX-like permease family protein [Candidatus Poribacteria bacterium]|nr:FtsX-like permease family protein [Candidatus Poribacteria bacterium]MYG08026.1 FtsX-like permease family protein [Candidatus Poribacteria bacterium]MYK21846.1 FtsX-like permease family protein [Candidatus Poribacteria bacterium]
MKLANASVIGITVLWQNRLRAGLSILGIFIGIASVLCMITLSEGAKKLIADDIEKLGGSNLLVFTTRQWIFKNGRLRQTRGHFTREDALAIEAACPNVLSVIPKTEIPAIVRTRQGHVKRVRLEGVTSDYAYWMRWEVQEGRYLLSSDIDNATQVCVLGHQVAADMFDAISPIGQEVKIRFAYFEIESFVRFTVVGVMVPRGRTFESSWSLDNVIFIPYPTCKQRIFNYHREGRKLHVFFKPKSDVESVIQSARAILRRRHRNNDNFADHWTVKKTVKQLEHFEKVFKIGFTGIAGFSLFVGGIGIMNICLVSVGEKTWQIGLRKAVGAKQLDIFWQFLTESVCLCLCGGVLGIVFGWLLAHGVARVAIRMVPIVPQWPVVLPLPWVVVSVLFSIFTGIVFGIYPAIYASRLTPIDSLRIEL